jgi:hypothetical protein
MDDDVPRAGNPCYRFSLEWEKWMGEGIADALMVYAPMPDAIRRVKEGIESKLGKGPVYLWREPWQAKHFEAYREEIARIRGGALDGCAIDELQQFLPENQRAGKPVWRELLEGL